jgi:hypothetical protein
MATALAVSLAVHAALAGAVVGLWLWRGWPVVSIPVAIDVSTLRADELRDLPLGLEPASLPSPGSADPESEAIAMPPPAELPARATAASAVAPGSTPPTAPRPKPKPKPRPPAESVVPAVSSTHATHAGQAGPRRAPAVTSVRAYAPAGSRVVALVRLDRLRGTPYAPAVDNLLRLLPDRRDLLEGTELDLYRDVDALLVATPNPLDAFVTLLVVRHRLSDSQLRAALEKGARATHRKLLWHTERGRPFAERRSMEPGAAPGSAARRHDERLILLAAPGLAVVTPPSYRKLILQSPRGAAAAHGSDPMAPSSAADGDGDGGWASLIGRIDAEDSILPADAVAMLSASGIFPSAAGSAKGITVMGVELAAPAGLTAVIGIEPHPFANLDLSFDTTDAAHRWAEAWPRLRQQLLGNPLVVLTGFAHILSGMTVSETSSAVRVHVETTMDETIRILTFLTAEIPLLRR